jgi:Zn ribbon nucleic-acid-binding protein
MEMQASHNQSIVPHAMIGEPRSSAMNEAPACKHSRTQLIAKDKDAEYVECKDCGAILETRELAAPAANEKNEAGESLSDA